MNFQIKMIGVLLVGLFSLASLSAATNVPPRYRLQRIEDWDHYEYSYVRTLLLNNRNQLAVMVEADDGPHIFIRGRNRTVEIPMTPEAPVDTLLDFNGNRTVLFWQSITHTAYRYRRGKFVNLTNLVPYKYLNPVAFNNHGRIVGGGQLDDGPLITAFTYYSGHYRLLQPLLPETSSVALDVNNKNQIVGFAQFHSNSIPFTLGDTRAVMFLANGTKNLGVLDGAHSSVATKINARGVVIGYCSFREQTQDGEIYHERGFVYRDGVMSPLQPLPGGIEIRPISINRRGLIVGYSAEGNYDNDRTAVLFLNGETFNLNDLIPPDSDVVLTETFAINDRGVIATRNEDGEVFLLFPE